MTARFKTDIRRWAFWAGILLAWTSVLIGGLVRCPGNRGDGLIRLDSDAGRQTLAELATRYLIMAQNEEENHRFEFYQNVVRDGFARLDAVTPESLIRSESAENIEFLLTFGDENSSEIALAVDFIRELGEENPKADSVTSSSVYLTDFIDFATANPLNRMRAFSDSSRTMIPAKWSIIYRNEIEPTFSIFPFFLFLFATFFPIENGNENFSPFFGDSVAKIRGFFRFLTTSEWPFSLNTSIEKPLSGHSELSIISGDCYLAILGAVLLRN